MRRSFESMLAELDRTPAEARPATLLEFLETDITADEGPWSLKGHEPFGEIIDTIGKTISGKRSDTEISILAAEQVGKTLVAIGAAIHLVADARRNVGYFFPTDKFAHKFGRTRLKRLISKSPYLAARMKDGASVNQATLKEFDGKFLYMFGLESMIGAISTPLDALLYDEVDLLPAENLEWSQGRVAHSTLRISVFVSAGYSPGAGIDRRYSDGTQHKYLVDCTARSCRTKGICLEEVFPECIARVKGEWKRVCPNCKQELDIKKNGRWVATVPSRARDKKISYRVSSLIIPARSANHIMKRWEKAKRKKSEHAKFRCAELAMPDAGAMQPVTDAELNRMRETYLMRNDRGSGAQRFAGMDAGDLCHLYVFERTKEGRPRVVWLEEIDSDDAENIVSSRIVSLGITSLVIDKKPLTNLARAIAYRFPRVVALQDFDQGATLKVVEEEHIGKKYRCVKIDRNESLDEFTDEITNEASGLIIPDGRGDTDRVNEVLENFAEHLKALRKERTVDRRGRTLDIYKTAVANHFGMAGNSARLAEVIAGAVMPFEYTPVPSYAETFEAPSFRPAKRWGGIIGG